MIRTSDANKTKKNTKDALVIMANEMIVPNSGTYDENQSK